ncbi:hypothetical protein COLO4_04842 [Corchorus olitorius]|uniref:Uncharacterized protein n=1 Tax=Corchorus olitorius TaxID=93759 RepID=A0A1R3KSL1_9ROSI|nr:hypothetical protein COLO4_04842 [Corchorus olitorius]
MQHQNPDVAKQPKKRHDRQYGVVEEVEEGQSSTPEDDDDRSEHVEETREVKDVRPEEDAAGRAGSEGETEEPLEWGLGTAPEPPGFLDFSGGGEEDSGEDDGGDDGHGEAVEGRDWTERYGSAALE